MQRGLSSNVAVAFPPQPPFFPLPDVSKTRRAGTSSFAHRSRHLHTSAHLHMREEVTSDCHIAYGRGGSGAHLARADKMPLSFSRALAISAVPTARYFSQQGTRRHVLIGGNGTNPSCQPFSLVSRDCARKLGTCAPRSCWFFVDIRY